MKKFFLPVVAGLVLFFVATYVSGQFGFYEKIPSLDKFYHFVGGVIVAWFFAYILSTELSTMSFAKKLLLLVACVCLVGVIWEFAERLSGVYAKDSIPMLYHYFHGGNLSDTLMDLVAGIGGGVVFALLLPLL